jgi:hypothetical protein
MDMNDVREIGSMGITESMERPLSTLEYRITGGLSLSI